MMGKYLNGYGQDRGSVPGLPFTYVPPGWSEWDVAGWGYPEFNYSLNEDGTVVNYGHQPSDYLTDVLADKGVDFINSSAAAGKPFFLELATFAPHSPVHARRRATPTTSPGCRLRDPPNFDVLPTNAPRWLAGRPPLTADQQARINTVFRLRAQSVQAVDQMIGQHRGGARRQRAERQHLHRVQLRQRPAHRRVPADAGQDDRVRHRHPRAAGDPGPRDPRRARAPTRSRRTSTWPRRSPRSAAPTWPATATAWCRCSAALTPATWRNAALIEHRGPDLRTDDPDFQPPPSGNPNSYEAMRTPDFLYVEYKDGEREFYDLRTDPFELHNLAPTMTLLQLFQLHQELLTLQRCQGGQKCWAAMHVQPLGRLNPAMRRKLRNLLVPVPHRSGGVSRALAGRGHTSRRGPPAARTLAVR